MMPPDIGWLFLPFLIIGMSALLRRIGAQRGSYTAPVPDRTGETIPEATVYRLAKEYGGKLTVSEVVVGTGVSVAEAEAVLQRMTDGAHVRMDVADSGVVWYVFPELQPRELPTEATRERSEEQEMAIDPICKMEVDEKSAKWTSEYEGKTYYFCAPGCKKEFDSDPKKYKDQDKK